MVKCLPNNPIYFFRNTLRGIIQVPSFKPSWFEDRSLDHLSSQQDAHPYLVAPRFLRLKHAMLLRLLLLVPLLLLLALRQLLWHSMPRRMLQQLHLGLGLTLGNAAGVSGVYPAPAILHTGASFN